MGKTTPQVSIIFPAYNQAVYLGQAIDNALAQTYRDFDIIIVDDGSTDANIEIAGYDDNIRYIFQENLGLGGARNAGIRAAQGNFVGLLDEDDI